MTQTRPLSHLLLSKTNALTEETHIFLGNMKLNVEKKIHV